ncbi:MAG TPA: DUF559 domain-containing protein [Nocardioidaceae bacterium]
MGDLTVWISDGGQKYHANNRCQGLRDGQRKTTREGGIARPVRRVELRSLRERTPCTICWHREPGWSDWSNLEHQVHRTSESPYEIEFFEQVLRAIPGLRPADVRVQREFTYDHAKYGRIDFTIESEGVKLAIEVDGLRKSPLGQPLNAQRHTDAIRRQNALSNQEWRILRFTNEEVRLDPDRCRAEIEKCLRRSRSAPPRSHESTTTTGRSAQDASPRRDAEIDRPSPGRAEPLSTSLNASATASKAGLKKPLVLVTVAVGVITTLLSLSLLLAPSDKSGAGSTSPDGTACPSEFPVKGNESLSGELIYHEPGWRYYARTRPERCFANGKAAEKAGFRPSKVR